MSDRACVCADGVLIVVTLRTPPNLLPLLGIPWETAADGSQADAHSAAWELDEYQQVQGGIAAQQQTLNIYTFKPV